MLNPLFKYSQPEVHVDSNTLHRIYRSVTNNKPKLIYTPIRKHYNIHLFG